MPFETDNGLDFTDDEVEQMTGEQAYEVLTKELPVWVLRMVTIQLLHSPNLIRSIENDQSDDATPNQKQVIVKGLCYRRQRLIDERKRV